MTSSTRRPTWTCDICAAKFEEAEGKLFAPCPIDGCRGSLVAICKPGEIITCSPKTVKLRFELSKIENARRRDRRREIREEVADIREQMSQLRKERKALNPDEDADTIEEIEDEIRDLTRQRENLLAESSSLDGLVMLTGPELNRV